MLVTRGRVKLFYLLAIQRGVCTCGIDGQIIIGLLYCHLEM